MIEMSLRELATVFSVKTDGNSDAHFKGVTIDSRKPCADELFVAIRGNNFDAHDFVKAAYKNGAVIALVERRVDCEILQIEVKNCREALGQLANYWRRRCSALVIGLTGSNGKTTVKEMTQQILDRVDNTLATRGNFNNDIGVPLTLFRLAPSDRFAIIEMGANHAGEIAMLANIAEPEIVYVNNVSAAHLTGFGSYEGVVAAKGELYDYCKDSHKALFNSDEVASVQWRKSCLAKTRLVCGINEEADLSAQWRNTSEGLSVEFNFNGQVASTDLEVLGEHNVRNAMAAVSLAMLAGVNFHVAVAKLTGFSAVDGRLQMLAGPAQSRIINDSYNANPASLEAGIRVICSLPGEAWLALGDMGELGSETEKLHRVAARTARQLGVTRFFGVGEMSCFASEEFGQNGFCYENLDDMAIAISSQLNADSNLLVKGSRSAGMERLVATLVGIESNQELSHAV